MSSGGGAGDTPAVLQLQKWDSKLQSQLQLSKFRLASISPSRDLLLLLSYQCEALLVPLVFGKFYSEDSHKSKSPRQETGPGSLEIGQHLENDENIKDAVFSHRGSFCTSEYCPIISNVKSLAWGHCGDAYSRSEESDFREILVVSSDTGIVAHAFRQSCRNELFESVPEGEAHTHGKWVEWGPNHRTEVVDVKNTHSGEDLGETSGTENVKYAFEDVDSSSGSKLHNWFQSFLVELDAIVSSGKYLAKFPAKSLFPQSAAVVSFDIYDNTLKFLDFTSATSTSTAPLSDMESLSNETVVGQVRTTICSEDSRDLLYTCSKVFNSYSHRLIGMVLNFPGNVSAANTEAYKRNEGKVLVVVMMLNQWGFQWVCSVDLQDQYAGSGPSIEWADFQFSEGFLVCLATSGLISIWGAETGNFVSRLDVLKSCSLHLNVCPGPVQSELSVNGESASATVKIGHEVDQNNDMGGREASNSKIVCSRTFRRLMVVSHSLILAVVDELGVVYVIWAAECVSKKNDISQRYLHPYKYSDIGILSSWKVAGSEIGSPKMTSDISPFQNSYVSNLPGESFKSENYTGETKIRNREHFYDKEMNLHNYRSGFSNCSQTSSWKLSNFESEMSSRPLSRIFLPLEKYNSDISICFSPFGITRLVKSCSLGQQKMYKIVQTSLDVVSTVADDGDLGKCCMPKRCPTQEFTCSGELIGCFFQGCLYLVTHDGLSVILPAISVSSSILPVETIRYWQPNTIAISKSQINILLETDDFKELGRRWQIEVLDRTLLYEGPEEAEQICLANGWDLKIVRLRRMQIALHYLHSAEIEKSLDMLVDANLAEEGILHLLFTCVYHIFCKTGSDSEVALASRLLTLAASFATKMVRRYGLAKHKQKKVLAHAKKDLRISYVKPLPSMHKVDEISYSRRLYEMARFLEVIRNLQSHLTSRRNRLGQVMTDATIVVDANSVTDGSPLPTVSMDSRSHGLVDPSEAKTELCLTSSDLAVNHTDKFALPPIESAVGKANPNEHYVHETGVSQRKKHISLENSKSMITRWGVDSIDLKTIVKDALESGRLPLAVLQLHLMKQKELDYAKDPHDTFSEISEIGRAIAYDLFLKGESGLAVETLLRLGEDVKIILRQLLFGTVRRKLRRQIAEEMRSRGHLTPHEWKTLERMFLIERLYPSFSFSAAFVGKKKVIFGGASASTLSDVNHVKLKFKVSDDLSIECGDIDGAVTGSWAAMCDGSPEVCEDKPHGAYWVSAAIWSDAWDQRTVDRIMLDQPLVKGVNVAWESQLEYSMSHSNCEEISKLLDVIPISRLSEGTLEICSNTSHISPNMRTDSSFLDHAMYICAPDELETVCMDIPHVKIFRSSAINTCSAWLKMLLEEELAKKYIFLKEYWENISEFIALLARAGLIINKSKITIIPKSSTSVLDLAVLNTGSEPHKDAEEALHKLVVHYCTQHNLPNLLDLYLDHSNLVLDDDSLSPFLEAAGDCQWAKWLLFSRIKGHEYEASLSNARSNMSRQMIRGSNLSVLNIDEIIRTVDDMAEGGGEMAALATLMYAAAPMQKCLSAGSVNRQCSFSSQCTLENLRPGLQQFPTLWRTLVTACLGQDDNTFCSKSNTTNVFGKSVLTDYLTWRDTIFSSSGGDTYLMQMLPCWFPKSIKKLVSLFVQGPLGWQSLPTRDYRETYVITATGKAGISPTNWEIAIQRNVEELYSSLEEKGFGVEHHLHRGRALAAFKHILSLRASKLKSAHDQKETFGQTNIQSDIQAILAPLTESEKSLLSSVVPLAIMHFEDSVLVASCSFLLELCGLPVSTLRVDLAVLQRISSYYNSIKNTAQYGHVSPKGSAIHAVSSEGDISLSLAQSLADNYIHHGFNNLKRNGSHKVSKGKKPSLSLMTVLQHLEKASLPLVEEGKTCGYWLSSGNGDGYDFRSQQKDASMQWNLVTSFCQMHQLPLSTKYLALLAKDNDWVGFLTEAQMGGFPSDVIVEVAAKEFTDPRLKTHVLTVLKSIHSSRKKTSPSTTNELTSGRNEMSSVSDTNTIVPVELFGLLAECERQKNPGEALLTKSKDLLWPLLAIIASCFSDVSPLSCLMVWLEITAARETSSIKVNDISSKIANSVGAAVEVTNALPCGSRSLMFHYNRRNPKRRRLVEPALGDFIVDGCIKVPSMSSSTVESIAQEITSDGRNKITTEKSKGSIVSDEGLASLSNMIAVLCEQYLFLPLLRAFEMFLPSCSLLPFIRSLQAFSQLRLSEASAHLTSFSIRIKEEPFLSHTNVPRDGQVKTSWISSTAVKSAESMLSTCPSAYEKRCLLQLLTAVDFGDGGSASSYFRRLYWKISLAEPPLRKDEDAYLGNEILDDTSLLNALVANGRWEQARNWARQLESSGPSWKAAVHQVTEAQAEAMVVEWKEYLWDVPEERSALWGHCQTLFLRYSFPPLQAGLFFLKHAEDNEKDIPARDLHEMLLLALQWLSGTITQSPPVYHLHLLREIETRVWLLAVESETQAKAEGDFVLPNSVHNIPGNSTSIIEQTANIIAKMDSHINSVRLKPHDRSSTRENNLLHTRFSQFGDSPSSVMAASSSRAKRRSKTYLQIRRPTDNVDINNDSDDNLNSPFNVKSSSEVSRNLQIWEDNMKIEASVSGWEEKVRPAEVERAILSLLEFGQITAAKQLQVKLSPAYVLPELVLVDAALKVAAFSSASPNGEISESQLDAEILSAIQALSISSNSHIDLLQVLESLAAKCGQGSGQGLCWRIIAVVKAAKVLGLTFSEAFEKRPIELLQLLSLKAQDSLEEAKLLVQTHVMSPPRIARILAESFLKGLLAAHRGGYMDSQKEEGPAPLLWRFSDFLKWAKLCPSEPEIGHALMRLVMTGQEIPHACEVELLILSHHFYLSSACLDGVDVLVTLAANRVESYVSEGGFSCLARLITGVSNFHALNFILNILIENGQLDLLLKKYSTAETGTATAEAVRGFRMSVLTSLKLFNPHDLDAFAMVYEHFDMKHETAALLQSRSTQYVQQWLSSRYRDRMTEDLLDAMRYTIDSAQVYSTIDAGHKTYRACARASLLSLQIRIPDLNWLELSETNARRMFVDQSRFQEALIVAEAYNLNQPSEWAPILWNLMLKPDVIEEFISEFVAVLPLQPSMLLELARFYRAEVAARGDQSHFSVWLSPGGLPAEWVKHLGRSFRSLLKRTRDLRVRIQLATIATGFGDVIDSCSKVLDKVPDSTVPLILRRGHGGAYLPLM